MVKIIKKILKRMKHCPHCEEYKELTQFYKDKNTKDKYQYICKKCNLKAGTKNRRANGGTFNV